MSILTDCSQRQERRGWLGDASLSVDAALFNFELYGLYVNFLRNIAEVRNDLALRHVVLIGDADVTHERCRPIDLSPPARPWCAS